MIICACASLLPVQPHAFLINTARGDVVDNDALIAALENKVIDYIEQHHKEIENDK